MLLCIVSLLFFSACSFDSKYAEIDKLNDMSYAYHYKNLDSTYYYANKALSLSGNYSAGRAEAYNNLAFFYISKMEYEKASCFLDSVGLVTDNQIELLIADIQRMRLCQRISQNKKFYDYREKAITRFHRINEESKYLSARLSDRMIYAKSEFSIVSSTYYYYLGLGIQSKKAILQVDSIAEIQKDTAQYLNYLYQLGSGGLTDGKTKYDVAQKEFEQLLKCYFYARQGNFVYWEANALQSISEHLLDKDQSTWLILKNKWAINYLNSDNMPDSLLAGNLAQRALTLFIRYGDVYQTAGAYRTLAFCYWKLGDYTSSLICLENALSENAINQAPALVASICEQLSLAYSAVDDKNNSDIYRNKYLDLQEETRQDRQLEARAEQLVNTSMQLNILIMFILFLILVLVVLFFMLKRLKKRKNSNLYIDDLLKPLQEWSKQNSQNLSSLDEKYEEADEQLGLYRLHIEKSKRRNLDNRAKVFLVNNVMPYIDRIINEIRRLKTSADSDNVKQERYEYMKELTDRINEYNDVLTHWIQLQQGQLSLHIESFKLQDVFDILSKSAIAFQLKGIDFEVKHSSAIVKADKIMTLFMLNTLSDNSRKFTQRGGVVVVEAREEPEYVEISVTDTGSGIEEQKLPTLFEHKVNNSHGFGLMNCKGIIDKYRKTSQIFNVCGIFAESKKGKGCKFYFRLPYGVLRSVLSLIMMSGLCFDLMAEKVKKGNVVSDEDIKSEYLIKANNYADSAYFSNINGTYQKTLDYADSSIVYLNEHYKHVYPFGKDLMLSESNKAGVSAEIIWFRKKIKTNYDIILDIRNECAVAALALHKWNLYVYNNKIYTQLFKEMSADNGLAEYCQTMQNSKNNKIIAIIFLVLLLVAAAGVYYFLYYRHVLFFRFCIDRINGINKLLLSDITDENKLSMINDVDTSRFPKPLKEVVANIKDALQRSVNMNESRKSDIEYLNDELNRARYEDEKLYVCNNVIDNCLSTLKHETMYYPSRIRQLVDEADRDITPLSEVATYYKELYAMLCEQIQRQIDSVSYECKPVSLKDIIGIDDYVFGDTVLIRYLFEIIKTQCGCTDSDISVSSSGKKYIVIDILCHSVRVDKDGDMPDLFVPSVKNIPFLICRQIVRDNSELTNLHGCGIVADKLKEGRGLVLHITLARYVSADIKNN